MKCFTVKIGDSSYIKNVPRVIVNSWNDKGIVTVSDVEEAKHYKTKGQCNAWIKSSTSRTESNIQHTTAELKKRRKESKNNNYGHWYIQHLEKDLEHYENVLSRLEDARTVELDIEIPNFYSKDGIKFDEYQRKYGGMTLHRDTTAKRVCKCCGVKMKNIPYFEFRNSNAFRVCVACLNMRIDAITEAFNGMDKEFREELTNEIILGNL